MFQAPTYSAGCNRMNYGITPVSMRRENKQRGAAERRNSFAFPLPLLPGAPPAEGLHLVTSAAAGSTHSGSNSALPEVHPCV